MEVHQAQADLFISAAVNSTIKIWLAYEGGSRPTAGIRDIHVAWYEQGENDGTRCLPFLVLELREGESDES